jgi:hypothetical protein
VDRRCDAGERARVRLHVPPRVGGVRRLGVLRASALAYAREDARAFFQEWEIDSEPGQVAIELDGDVGLVPLGGDPA